VNRFPTAALHLLGVGILMTFAASVSAQQAYPGKPIRIITPFPPGGSTSILARLIGQKLTDSWGQQVIVDNRGGGNTIIGTEALARSAPDGYTLIHTNTSLVVVPQMIHTSYDPVRDFAPIATLVSSEFVLLVHPSVPANNVREFIALAKSMPGKLNYASSGSGSPNHLAAASFELLAGVKMEHVPYKGTGPSIVDLLAGQVQLAFFGPINAMPHIKSSKLRPIAVTGEHRLAALPQLPTFTEAGLLDFSADNWQGILAPAGAPKAIVDKLSAEIAKILTMPDIKESIALQGAVPFASTPEQFAAFIKAEVPKWANVIKAANVKLEE
jgi:tripartite-type tricarboxylate transporter receptor subunit TctC